VAGNSANTALNAGAAGFGTGTILVAGGSTTAPM
jgi:hypothetical protein